MEFVVEEVCVVGKFCFGLEMGGYLGGFEYGGGWDWLFGDLVDEVIVV